MTLGPGPGSGGSKSLFMCPFPSLSQATRSRNPGCHTIRTSFRRYMRYGWYQKLQFSVLKQPIKNSRLAEFSPRLLLLQDVFKSRSNIRCYVHHLVCWCNVSRITPGLRPARFWKICSLYGVAIVRLLDLIEALHWAAFSCWSCNTFTNRSMTPGQSKRW